MEFLDIVVRYPGSVHDARMFDNSTLRAKMEDGRVQGILLGDSGYPCRHYLLTPVLRPVSPAEVQYNAAHVKTRSTAERAFGVWKARFRCLHRGLTNQLKNVVAIICATAVLHNIAQLSNDAAIDDIEVESDDDDMLNINVHDPTRQGSRVRQNLIATHFVAN